MVDVIGFLSFLGGVVAGAGGSFGGKYLWKQYTEPELSIQSEVKALSIEEPTDDGIERVATLFQVLVTNTGKVAAQNARPRVQMKSDDLPSPAEQWWEPPEPDELPDDVDPDDVVEPKLEGMEWEIDTAVVWSEGERPSRITINPGETVSFDLLRLDQRNRNEQKGIQKVDFPSEVGWERPARFEYQITLHEVLPRDPTVISKYQLLNGDWKKSRVEVTSENAEKIQGELEFNEEGGWTQITVEQIQ